MNKQDLKEGQEVYVKGRVIHTGDHLNIVLDEGSFIENAIVLHYKKPVVPQMVAEIIEYYKRNNATLYDALRKKNFNKQYSEWLLNEQNAYDKVAKAWLDGYEVEKEKRYKVVMPNVSSSGGVLTRIKHDDSWIWIDTLGTIVEGRTHTRKELEEAGFGWVFDCPGIEVEEMQE